MNYTKLTPKEVDAIVVLLNNEFDEERFKVLLPEERRVIKKLRKAHARIQINNREFRV